MTLSLDDLRRLHATLDETSTLDQPHPLSIPETFPDVSEITMITFNFFDNGPNEKATWIKSRHAMNLQVFTRIEPFTPSSALAAWEGTIQLHSTSFVGRYLTAKFPREEEIARPMLLSTDSLDPSYTDVMIGQLFSKKGGTRYVWGTMLRTYTDEFGEMCAELLQGSHIVRDQGFTPVCDTNRPTLKMVGRYDPHGLWQPGKRKFHRAPKVSR